MQSGARSSMPCNVNFEHILRTLLAETGKVEASFASKMAATLDPSSPVIDRHVLSYVGRKLPISVKDTEKRIGIIVGIHKEMGDEFGIFLAGLMENIWWKALRGNIRAQALAR
jgi:hypothetical protein